MKAMCAVVITGCLLVTASAQTAFSPARYRDGPLPSIPVQSAGVGGGEVLLEVTVRGSGDVALIRPLRTTASFTELMVAAVRSWRFVPAEEDGEVRAGKVLVAGMFRPPALLTPTLGEEVRDVAAPSDEAPFLVSTVMPPFPPRARNPGVVLVEARVNTAGIVVDVKVLRSAPPFDEPAQDAARRWKFRPARVRGTPTPSFAYIVFGFPVPTS